MATTATQEERQVVEFELGAERYCMDISYVAEITKVDELTTVPNASRHVQGVMDLRGRTTSIVDPKSIFSLPEDGEGGNVVVLDPEKMNEDTAVGWLVDEVTQVSAISDEDVESTTMETDEAVRGIVRRDEEFVIWVDPGEVGV